MYIYEDTILNFVLENRVPVSDIEGCESCNVSHFTKYFNNIFQNIYRDFHYIIAYQPRNVGCNDHNEFETCNAVKKNIFFIKSISIIYSSDTGSNSGPYCREISCDLELHYASDLQEGCTPVYFGDDGCCPIQFRCRKQKNCTSQKFQTFQKQRPYSS